MNNHMQQVVMEERYCRPYNWCFDTWHRAWRQKNGLWRIAKELTGSLEGRVVLDAGCGDGWYTAKMSEETTKVFGIDVSERAINFARVINSVPNFVCGSLVAMEYPDAKFDVVMSFQVIEHIPLNELAGVVKEIHRILKDDGVLVLSVPSVNRTLSKAHFQHFTLDTLKDVFVSHFDFQQAFGQEYHTPILHFVERVVENRFWVLKPLAEKFNEGYFMKYWNKTDQSKGQNLVARFKKRKK